MDRKEFIKNCSYACAGIMVASLGISSCTSVKYIQASNENSQLRISRSEFTEVKNEKTRTRSYVIVKANNLDYPIVLYRFAEEEYCALLLRCTHQGNELNVHGDLVSCSAHGSEFSNKGQVLNGPADQPLQSFKVTTDAQTIHIHLA